VLVDLHAAAEGDDRVVVGERPRLRLERRLPLVELVSEPADLWAEDAAAGDLVMDKRKYVHARPLSEQVENI
jgi:hypothetical protein